MILAKQFNLTNLIWWWHNSI